MARDTMASLKERIASLELDNARLFAGFQAATSNTITWYGRKTYDGTSFRFGVLGLTRADGGYIVIQTRVNGEKRPYTVCYLIDDAMQGQKYSGSDYWIALGEFYHQAQRMRNDALDAEYLSQGTVANAAHSVELCATLNRG